LVYQFDGWLGDELLEAFPCFIVTGRLATAIEASDLTGARFGPVEVAKSALFEELHPALDIPQFRRLHVFGNSKADFSLDSQHRLCVSDSALALLKRFSLANCEVNTEG